MQTDIEIAQSATVEPIAAVAEKAHIPSRYVEPVSYTHLTLPTN